MNASLSQKFVYPPKQTSYNFINPQKILRDLVIVKGMKVADLGCGGGYFTIPAGKMVKDDGIVYAVDIQKSILQDIESKAKLNGLKNIKTIWADLEILGSTKINKDFVDLAIISNVLFQSKKPKAIIEEGKRIIKPKEGKLVIIDWIAKGDYTIGPSRELRVPEEKIEKIANELDLNLIDKFIAENYHYVLVFIKS